MSPKEVFNPVNPLHMSPIGLEKFLTGITEKRDGKDGAIPRFKGVRKFMELVNNHELGIGTIIRIRDYGRTIEAHYIIAEAGLVEYGLDKQEDKTHSPDEILGKKQRNPYWEVVGQGFTD